MNLQEMYRKIEEDYEEAVLRIPREKSLIKFLRIFAADEEFGKMIQAAKDKDYTTVFTTSHNIKGVCANLCLNKLAKVSSEICEAVRGGNPTQDITPQIDEAIAIHDTVVAAINQLED